ncbi:ATPase family AAA domain-containing protein 3C-like [Lolium rigidum]|uniref:ATPase family AAA domain-containing protein 3C-like n=1 Tax=Lolium rigidum TaxID=89674 RepID=UPI001F5CCB30|nr:ATPase family AAA domain-containing protein 3C-like [Lolium rigidum]
MAAAAAAKAAAAALSAGAAFAASSGRVHAGLIPGWSSPSPAPAPGAVPGAPPAPEPAAEEKPRVRNDNPRTSASGFNPEPLEEGVKLLDEMSKKHSSTEVKKTFEHLKKVQDTKQAELAAKKAEYTREAAILELERTRTEYEEKKKLAQTQAEIKSQVARYNDELARKRLQNEHEAQRTRNHELVKMQEESALKIEHIRRQFEEEIQELRKRTQQEMAAIEQETQRQKSRAEAEAKALEKKLSEDVNRRMLIEKANAEREKWVQAINATFEHIGGGLRTILTDQSKLTVAVIGVTGLAAGIYTTREGARVVWGYVDRILGQPSLIRESSRGKYPWSGVPSRAMSTVTSKLKNGSNLGKDGKGFGDVILNPSLQKRVNQLANATANTKLHQAPFRNMLFYGPPGTGKTMAARELARESGLDYALMTGGDVAPLGAQAVTKIHQLFDWAKKSDRGLLLFIDEADAFLCERNKTYMSEAQRSALNALLYRTGSQSKDFVLALATNRPGDLDSAVADRIDEVLEFPLPGEEERSKIVKLYLDKYIVKAGEKQGKGLFSFFRRQPQKIAVKGITDDLIREAAAKTEGFSGREIAKLLASVQAAVYGSTECELTPALFREVVDYKVAEHQQRRKIAGHA